MTADSDPPLASEAPASSPGPHDHRIQTLLGRVVAALLLTIGCMSVGHAVGQTDASNSAVSSVPSPVDEMTVSTATASTIRQRLIVARRRFPRSVRRVLRRVEPGRFAHWLLPVQLRLMPPVWRGPTVLRL